METTEGLLRKVLPPRLEDAGLEHCALPPDSIKAAFLKAAAAVRSVVTASEDEDYEGRCVNDPWPTGEEKDGYSPASDAIIGIKEGTESPPGACSAVKGGGDGKLPDKVAIVGENGGAAEVGDEVVAPPFPEGGDACVDGLRGLKIGGEVSDGAKKLEIDEEDDEDEDNDKEKPILIGGHV